jgi:hypothetical protein
MGYDPRLKMHDLEPVLPPGLDALARLWLDFPGRTLDFNEPLPPPSSPPPALVATITSRAPHRERVLADAALWSRLGRPAAAAADAEQILLEPPPVEAWEGWPRSLSPLVLRVEWARTIAGLEVDFFNFGIHRVVEEDGAWRVAALYDDRSRRQVERVIAYLDGRSKRSP